MLLEISVSNLAIIEDIHVRFEAGLNILTGQTGAGKSIVVGAINLIIGQRASSEMIRTGADTAQIQAVFDLTDTPELKKALVEMDVPCDRELIVRRVINKNGNNRVYLNGALFPLTPLKDVGESLVNIYGQHESHGLLKSESHLGILDAYGALASQREQVARSFAAVRSLRNELDKLRKKEFDRALREDYLLYLIREIEGADLKEGELLDLETQKRKLKGADKLAEATRDILESGYEGEGGILERAETLMEQADRAYAYDDQFLQVKEYLDQIAISARELGHFCRTYMSGLDHDPDSLVRVEDRIHLIRGILKKHGPDETSVMENLRKAKDELADLDSLADQTALKQKEVEEAAADLHKKALSLSEKRKKAGRNMSREIESELCDLDLKGARFVVSIEPFEESGMEIEKVRINETGRDKVEFLLSANLGEQLRPLSKTASGGELSRILLAIKNALARNFFVPTLVFDEVDSGIGGKQAEIVGTKLAAVSKHHQVLCITHLPQIAAKADHHFRVEKKVRNGRSVTLVEPLSAEERVLEVARLLSGKKVTDVTLAAAREMISD